MLVGMNKIKGNKSIHPVPGHSSQNSSLPLTQVIPSDYPSKKYKNPIIPDGSSFDRIQLEVGVTFKEDQKYKTGGKDFFRKYKRYSVENFQRQVGITQSSPKKIGKKEETKTEPIEEKEGFYGSDFENTEPSAMNNTIHLKTKNLRQAMKNLDLITEEEESEMQKQFNKTKPDNLFTYGNKTTSNEDKYDGMDKFAKTLLTSSDWAPQP